MSALISETIKIPALHELRIELDKSTEAVALKLTSGRAEIFGFELVKNSSFEYPITDYAKVAVFAIEDATVVLKGAVETYYIASETSVPSYTKLHLALSKLRYGAVPSSKTDDLSLPDDEVLPPRVLIVGETGAGKTTLTRTLANWFVRQQTGTGATAGLPVVNLDTANAGPIMPGTLSIARVDKVIPTTSPSCSFGSSATSGPAVLGQVLGTEARINPASGFFSPNTSPIAFWYGHLNSTTNQEHFDALVRRTAAVLKKMVLQGGLDLWKAGYLVDTPGEWAEKKNLATVAKAARELAVNYVVVLGNERLFVDVTRQFQTNKAVKVIRLPKSGGATEPDLSQQIWAKDLQIRSYFYGGPAATQGLLSPFLNIVKFSDLSVFQIGDAEGAMAPDSALPIGATRQIQATELVPLDITDSSNRSLLVNRVLSIPQAQDIEAPETIMASPVLGFVWISSIDYDKEKVTLLSPVQGRLPRKTLLASSIDWVDA